MRFSNRLVAVGLALLAGVLFFSSSGRAAGLENAAALNKAGNLHLLAERIARNYALVGQDVLAEKSRRQLTTAIGQFDKQLKEMQAYAPTPEIKENYALLEQLWETYRAAVQMPPERAKVKELSEFNEEVVWIAQKGAQLVEAHAKLPTSRLINLASEQRTLSQRMAKLYLFRSWGLGSKVLDDDLRTARTSFVEGLRQLGIAPQNTDAVRNELKLAEQQWYFFDQAIKAKNNELSEKTRNTNVATTSDRMLEVMDRVASLYESMKL